MYISDLWVLGGKQDISVEERSGGCPKRLRGTGTRGERGSGPCLAVHSTALHLAFNDNINDYFPLLYCAHCIVLHCLLSQLGCHFIRFSLAIN